MDKNDFEILAVYSTLNQAEFAKSYLASFGIQTTILEENTARNLSFMMPGLNGVHVLVSSKDFEQANELLQDIENIEESKSSLESKEDKSQIENSKSSLKRAYILSFFSLLIPIIFNIISFYYLALFIIEKRGNLKGEFYYLLPTLIINGLSLLVFFVALSHI
ncbi:MAG: DUF2007 domain-containing protein [Pseudomonadota bacterium]